MIHTHVPARSSWFWWSKYSDTTARVLSFQVSPREVINPVLYRRAPRSANKQKVSDCHSRVSPALPPKPFNSSKIPHSHALSMGSFRNSEDLTLLTCIPRDFGKPHLSIIERIILLSSPPMLLLINLPLSLLGTPGAFPETNRGDNIPLRQHWYTSRSMYSTALKSRL